MIRPATLSLIAIALLATTAAPALAYHGHHYVITGSGLTATATAPPGWVCTQPDLVGVFWLGRCTVPGATWCADPDVNVLAVGITAIFLEVSGDTYCHAVTPGGPSATLHAACSAWMDSSSLTTSCTDSDSGYLAAPIIEMICTAQVDGLLGLVWTVDCAMSAGP